MQGNVNEKGHSESVLNIKIPLYIHVCNEKASYWTLLHGMIAVNALERVDTKGTQKGEGKRLSHCLIEIYSNKQGCFED